MENKIFIGNTLAPLILCNGFKQRIYKKVFAPKTLEVWFKMDPNIQPEAECKNAFFVLKIYGHDSKSKGKKVQNEITVPFIEIRHLLIFSRHEQKGILLQKYLEFYQEEYCPIHASEENRMDFLKKSEQDIVTQFTKGEDPIRLTTYFNTDSEMPELYKEYTLYAYQLQYLPKYNGEPAKKPWIFSIDRWVGTNYGNLDSEPVLMGGVEEHTAIRMSREDFLEFTGCIENAVHDWLCDIFRVDQKFIPLTKGKKACQIPKSKI